MAEVAARKRARSSSPVCDALASPLEVLLKRRRRDLSRTSSVALPPPSQPIFHPPAPAAPNGDAAMPSSSSPGLPESSSPGGLGGMGGMDEYGNESLRGIERRRTRNWERLNAPAGPAPGLAGPSCEPDSSPVARRMSNRNLVSSSPVRHQPPPPVFRDEWSAEERIREWGSEYASQNSVLHSLVSLVRAAPGASWWGAPRVWIIRADMQKHLARLESQQSLHSLHSVASGGSYAYEPFELAEPGTSPMVEGTNYGTSPMMGNTPQRTPASVNPWRTHQTPGFTPGFTSSEYVSSPLFSPPHNAHGGYPGPLITHVTPSRGEGHGHAGYGHGEVRASYEETNRLLAELNFARLRRHDAMSSSPPPPSSNDPAMDEQW